MSAGNTARIVYAANCACGIAVGYGYCFGTRIGIESAYQTADAIVA
jgi:hypothetical protein